MTIYVGAEMAKILAEIRAAPAFDFMAMPVQQARGQFEIGAAGWNRGAPAMAAQDIVLPGAAGPLRGRLFRPSDEPALPVILYAHGGGWTFGSVDTHDGTMRNLAKASGCAVLGFDYRLAPEHPFPAPSTTCSPRSRSSKVVGGIVCLQLLLGLGAALLLNQSFWWRGAARALVIIPWALPSVIIGLMWTWIYDFNVGVFNDILIRLGILSSPIAWLANPSTALACVMLALVWQGFPFFTVMILAGLQTVPAELYEAAEIDGASRWRKFVHVTAPGIAGIVATAVLLRIIWVANSLDVILVMTGGGPGYATYTLPLYAFLRAYTGMEFGYAAALALVLTAILLSVVWLYVRRQAKEMDT